MAGNVGFFSVIGGREARGRYPVVEPLHPIAALLQENLRRNSLEDVEVLEGAAIPKAEPCEVLLSVPDEGHDMPVGAHLTEGVEIKGRDIKNMVRVRGYPITQLMSGRDLVKIDAEGIEAALLEAAQDIILENKPTLLVEILPGATNLAACLAGLARNAGYTINFVPEFGSDELVPVAPEDFSSELPQHYNSKDVVLSTRPVL